MTCNCCGGYIDPYTSPDGEPICDRCWRTAPKCLGCEEPVASEEAREYGGYHEACRPACCDWCGEPGGQVGIHPEDGREDERWHPACVEQYQRIPDGADLQAWLREDEARSKSA